MEKRQGLTLETNCTPLLPRFEELQQLLGLKTSLAAVVLKLANEHNVQIPVSRATLFKLNSLDQAQGVSAGSRGKVLEFLHQYSPANVSFSAPKQPNGGAAETGWVATVSCLKKAKNNCSEWQFALEFIAQRIELEDSLLKHISGTDVHNNAAFCKAYKFYACTLEKNTLLPSNTLIFINKYFAKQTADITYEELASWLCHSRLDFYFSLVALLELGWLERLRAESPALVESKPTWFKSGIIGSFIKPLRIDGHTVELYDSFKLFLDWLASDIGTNPTNRQISKAKLASFIPLNNDQETANGYSLDEKKKDLLKSWRNGQLPSPEKFHGFISNLRSSNNHTTDIQFLTDMGMAVMGLDRLFADIFKTLEQFQSLECYKIFRCSMSRYSEYFKHFQAVKSAT